MQLSRPLGVRLINSIGGTLYKLGLGSPLNADDLMQLAIRKAGSTDFGGMDFLPALEQLCSALEKEAELTAIGRNIARNSILSLLIRRLEIIEYRAQHPEVAQQAIRQPLFIVGMPRTGTTILYELLAQDPHHRFPISWEVEQPVPPACADSFYTDPRIAAIDKQFDQVDKLVPGFKAMHEIGAQLPQECVAILAAHFMSEQLVVCYNIPSYRKWLMAQDLSEAYQWHKTSLQHMQSGFGEKKRWLLKTPPHIGYLETILNVYPDAKIVQTHRDPMQVLGSLSSLTCSLRSLATDTIDPVQVGQEEIKIWKDYLTRGMEARERLAEQHSDQFFDVRFEDMLKRPLAVIESLYHYFDFDFSDPLKQKMKTYLENRPRDKHGRHEYSLADYGLDAERDAAQFCAYTALYLPASLNAAANS
ncbi:MAG: hypothetical protein ACI89D_002420 [Bermanella sp.]|jgi:hypothetical protein